MPTFLPPRTLSSLTLLLVGVLGAVPALAQSPEPVVSVGDTVGAATVTAITDIAVEDDGSWTAVAEVSLPGQASVPVVLSGNAGPGGFFLPGAVPAVPGVTARIVNVRLDGAYTRTGNLLTVTVPSHGYLPGGFVRLAFSSGTGTEGLYTVETVPDADTFTVLDPVSGSTLGGVSLQRIFGPPDLHVPFGCGSSFLGLMQMGDDDDPLTPPVVTPSTDETGLFWNDVLLLRQASTSQAPEFGPGTVYKRLLRTAIDRSRDCLLVARLEDPAVSGQIEAIVRLDLDTGCAPSTASLLSEHALVRTGMTIGSSSRHFSRFVSTEKHTLATNARGDLMYLGWTDAPGIDRRVLYNARSIQSEFSRLPGGNSGFENVLGLTAACLDLNDLGDYVYQVRHTTPTPNVEGAAIVRGNAARFTDQAKLYQTGDVLSDPSVGGATIRMIGLNLRLTTIDWPGTFPVFMTNSGDVVWFAEWIGGSIGTGTGAGIFVNDKLVVERGQSFGPGYFLDDIGVNADLRRQLEVSPDGRYLLFVGRYTDPSFNSLVGVFRVDLGESMPFGTVAQAGGSAGCTHPYPGLTLQSQPGVIFPGTGALGDFPLIGHTIQAHVSGAPPATSTALFVFTSSALANYPCGDRIAPFGYELLIGAGRTFSRFVPYVGGGASYSAAIPLNPALIGSTWYGQSFFFNGGLFLGTSNGMRYVVGAN